MSFKLLTGPFANTLTRLEDSQVVFNPSAVLTFPSPRAYDGRASLPAMFSAGASDSTISVDTDLYGATGGFDSDADAAAWTVLGVGFLTSNGADSVHGVAAGFLVQDSSTDTIAYKDVTVRAGEELNFAAQYRVDSTGSDAALRLRNLQTGAWLKSDGTWDASTMQNLATIVGTTDWTPASKTFTVQDLDTCKADQVTLRTYLYADGGQAWFDDVTLFPSLNWASIHGHNIPPFITPKLERSDDNIAWTTEQTMTLKRDTFAVALSSLQAHRYWRVLFSGTPDPASLMYVGELIFGQYWEASRQPHYDGTVTWTDNQTRLHSAIGDEFVHYQGLAPQRKLHFDFTSTTDAEYIELHKRIFRASRGGGNPIVLNVSDLDSEIVVFGRIGQSLAIAKNTPQLRTTTLEILELALPSATNTVAAYDAPITAGG